jgi:hypothetical protein
MSDAAIETRQLTKVHPGGVLFAWVGIGGCKERVIA